jgi:hypothetical protein
MEEKSNIINFVKPTEPTDKVDTKFVASKKYHSNPIFKKMFVINVKNDEHKFSVRDLFE